MRKSALGLLAYIALASSALAQVTSSAPVTTIPAPGAIQGTNAIQTCGPFNGTLTNAGDAVIAPCPGAMSYIISLTPNGATALTGQITSSDSTTGGGRLLFKTGVNELDTNTLPMTGTSGSIEYRTVGAGFGQKISLSCPTTCSGSETVSILGSYGTSVVFPNAPIHTSDEAAVRNGHAFSASTSYQALAAGQNLSLYINNPASNNLRLMLVNRILSCDTTTSLSYFGISNPTVNLPATAVTSTNRRTGGAATVTTVAYGVATSRPDTSPTTASPLGGIQPALGGEPTVPLRTLEPGNSFAQWITAPAGLGTTAHCAITFAWYEEPTN